MPSTATPTWRSGIPVGALAGIPVRLLPSALLGGVVLTAVYTPFVGRLVPGTSAVSSLLIALTLALLLGLSVLLHELGHCLAAALSGVGVRGVELSLLGGSTELATEPRRARTEGLVAGAGPAVSVLLAVVALGGWAAVDRGAPLTLPSLLLLQVGLANAAVAVTNLLPGLPLDGGRVLRALAWGITGRPSAGTTAARVGSVLVALVVGAWGVQQLVSGGRSALVQVVVAAVLVWIVLDGARAEVEQAEPVTVLGARTPLHEAVRRPGVVLASDDAGVARAELDRTRAAALLVERPDAVLGEAVALLRPEQLVGPGVDRTAARDTAGVGTLLVLLDDSQQPVGVLR